MDYVDNNCPIIFCNRQSREEYYNKQLLLTIMMQLAFQKNSYKHLWHNPNFQKYEDKDSKQMVKFTYDR